jgi:hypothetical protein
MVLVGSSAVAIAPELWPVQRHSEQNSKIWVMYGLSTIQPVLENIDFALSRRVRGAPCITPQLCAISLSQAQFKRLLCEASSGPLVKAIQVAPGCLQTRN